MFSKDENETGRENIHIMHPPMPPSDDSGPEEGRDEDSYKDVMQQFSEEWLQTQLTHHVSLSATNAFWRVSMNFIPKIMELRNAELINRKVPQFNQVFTENIFKII